MEYIFTLKFEIPGGTAALDAHIERLAAEGCDDALVGSGIAGRLALVFTREAVCAAAAVESALEGVQRAIPGARLVEAAPDFVGLSDVAALIGVSRQNMRKLMLSHSQQFPQPVHDGSTAIWHLADLLEWLNERGNYRVPAATHEIARETLRLNLQGSLLRYGHCLSAAAAVPQ